MRSANCNFFSIEHQEWGRIIPPRESLDKHGFPNFQRLHFFLDCCIRSIVAPSGVTSVLFWSDIEKEILSGLRNKRFSLEIMLKIFAILLTFSRKTLKSRYSPTFHLSKVILTASSDSFGGVDSL